MLTGCTALPINASPTLSQISKRGPSRWHGIPFLFEREKDQRRPCSQDHVSGRQDLDPYSLAPTKKRIGRHIWILRRVRRTTRKDLAGKLGVVPKMVGHWENGMQLMTCPMLCKVPEYLNAPVDVLFDGQALVKFVKDMLDKSLDEGGLPEVDLSDRLELVLAARNMDVNSLTARFGVSAKEFRSWVELSSRLSLEDSAEAVGFPKEALLGSTIPDIA